MKLTVFTPSYNRAELLPRVYKSFLKQKNKEIEWLIVDDGSTDNTEAVVSDIIKNAPFSVRYIRKKNGGKHTAHNVAVCESNGEWVMCLDSDDYLTDDAIDSILEAIHNCDNKNSIILAYKQDTKGNLLSEEFLPSDKGKGVFDILEEKKGEYVFIFKTDIVKKYPYPVYEGERFSGECILYDKLHILGHTSDVLLKSVQCCEYQTDGLSNNFYTLLKRNPCGFQVFYMQRIDLVSGTKQRFFHGIKYCAFRILGKFKAPKYTGSHKFTVLLAYPFGILASLYYKLR